MTYENGEIYPRTKDEWLDAILNAGSDYWGDDITDREETSVHEFYDPFAGALADLEQEFKNILDGVRIDTAEKSELDLIGERFGVTRLSARKANGLVTFSRSTTASNDYLISSGTVVETAGDDPIRFETTETVTLTSGSTSVQVPIEALQQGSRGNVAAGSITEAPVLPNGVEEVSNSNPTKDGRDEETDDAYRIRIKRSVGNIEATSGYEIYNILTSKDFIKEVRFVDNSSDTATGNLSSHQFEVVVDTEPGHNDEIAQTIFENMPMGGNIVAGNYGSATSGTATLPNGQTYTIPFSEPADVEVFVDVTVTTNSSVSKNRVKDAVVDYIGGTASNGERIYGALSSGDDVVYGDVDFAIRTLQSVYDITSLSIGTADNPTGTSNIPITLSERPFTTAANVDVTVN